MNEATSFGALAALLVAVAVVFVALRALLRSAGGLFLRVTVPDWQSGLLYRDGRFLRLLPAGAHWLLPHDGLVFLPKNESTIQTAAQEVLTADLLQVKVVALVVYRVVDPRRAYESVATGVPGALRVHYDASVQTALVRESQLVLRDIVSAGTLTALLEDRKAADAAFLAALVPVGERHGVAIERAYLRDVILPADMRRLYADKERARIEGETALVRARSEQATLRSLLNAARLIKDNPDLATLRLLQALTPPPGSPAPTLVVGAPALGPGIPPRGGGNGSASRERPPAD